VGRDPGHAKIVVYHPFPWRYGLLPNAVKSVLSPIGQRRERGLALRSGPLAIPHMSNFLVRTAFWLDVERSPAGSRASNYGHTGALLTRPFGVSPATTMRWVQCHCFALMGPGSWISEVPAMYVCKTHGTRRYRKAPCPRKESLRRARLSGPAGAAVN